MPDSTIDLPTKRAAKKSLIGQRIPKLDAPEKATGLARYLEDIKLPRMLYGKILFADRPHARIVDIDTSAAKKIRGVRAVLTAADIKLVPFGFGQDNTALKAERVTCIRDEVAAVAADSPEIAALAIRRIRVTYEDLPLVTSPEQAMADGAPVIHEKTQDNIPFRYDYEHGDIEKGIQESDAIVEDTFDLQRMAHCCLGTSGIIADFDAQGSLTLHSLTQVPFQYKHDIAPIVGVPPQKIRVIQPPIGGGFGSKLDIHPFEPICVFLARATARPVRLTFTRQEEFLATPTRQPMAIHMKSGAKKDGTLTFRDVRMTLDNGGRTSWGATTPWIMMRTFSSLYRVPHVRQHADVVYTNNIYACAFRGYGNPQATFALESQIELLAHKLGHDPLEMRLKNAHDSRETTAQGMFLRTCGLKECLRASADKAGWNEKRNPVPGKPVASPGEAQRVPWPSEAPPCDAPKSEGCHGQAERRPEEPTTSEGCHGQAKRRPEEPTTSKGWHGQAKRRHEEPTTSKGWHGQAKRRHEEPTTSDGWHGPTNRLVRGLGMASLFHVGGGAKIYRSDGCGTMLQIDDFGTVTVMTGASEIGQGSDAVIAQIVAEELGLPLKNIRIVNNDTDVTPWDVGVHASRTTFIAGNSALRAAREARRKLIEAAAAKLQRKPEELDLSDGNVIERATGQPVESLGKIIRGIHFGAKNALVMTSEYYEPPSSPPDKKDRGDISGAYAFGTHVAEVEVDLDTGLVKVLKICAAHDVGRVINQLGIEGQIEGGIAQGLGYGLTEDIQVDAGRVLNPSFTDYKLITTRDLPEMEFTFVETRDPAGPHGAKGFGESPLIPVAAAVANAVYNATGVRITELPLTPERVLQKLQEAQV